MPCRYIRCVRHTSIGLALLRDSQAVWCLFSVRCNCCIVLLMTQVDLDGHDNNEKWKVFAWPRRNIGRALLCTKRMMMMKSKFNTLLPVHRWTQWKWIFCERARNLPARLSSLTTKYDRSTKQQKLQLNSNSGNISPNSNAIEWKRIVITGAFCGFSPSLRSWRRKF